MAGYTLKQLLTWCLEDRLIDAYEETEQGVIIWQGRSRHLLSPSRAHHFLAGVFGGSPYGRMKMKVLLNEQTR